MKKKLIMLLLVTIMVLGVFNLAAGTVEERDVSEKVLDVVPLGDSDAPYGERPEFVEALKAIGTTYAIMSREKVQINGQPLESDLPPVIIEDRIHIPLRAVSTALGAEVSWNGEERLVTITRDGVVIVLKIGEEEITVNGTIQKMDVSAQILGDRTFVPIRFVAVALGDSVLWNPVAKEAIINSQKR